ncbi:MAG: DUF6541 family protein [Actinomycetales bacterium]
MFALEVVAATAVLIVLVFGPGLLATYLLGLRGVPAWALAAPVSCALFGLGGLAVELAGVRWSLGVLAALTVVTAVLAHLLSRILAPARRDPGPALRWAVVGWLVGAGSVVAGFAASIGSVRAVPAQPDATYHLNAIRWMASTGDISSRDGGAFLYGRVHSFYPSTFHGIAATAVNVLHQQPVVVANLLSVVAGSVVWVVSCIALSRQAFGCHGRIHVLTGVAAASFTTMPYWMAGYGPLWPYLLGLSLVPALLACVLSLLGLATDDAIGRPRAAMALVVGAAGLGLVHPHAVSALVLVSYVALVAALLGRLATRRTGRAALFAAVGVLLPVAAWWVALRTPKMHGMTRAYARGPEQSVSRAVTEALLNGPRYGALLWVTSAVVVVGLVVCARRASTRWVPAAYVVLVLVLVGVAGVQSGFTRALTVFWYNDPPRLGALVPLAGVPALVAGLDAGGKALGHLVFRSRPRDGQPLATPVLTAAVVVAYLVATLGNNQGAHVGRLKPFYQPKDPARALLTTADASALQRLGRLLPVDAVVADNPWRGHALLYAFTSRRVLFYSEKAVTTPDRELLADGLYLAPSRPDVCDAVRRAAVTYVVTGGSNELPNLGGRNMFAGVDRVAGSPGFAQVAVQAPYTLWRVTACN